jgi:hydroxymethylpyrimidine kinase/phosphomethylpyrimidine kinase
LKSPVPNLLSIAGSDPSGGAGIQADLKTFAALGCYGMAVPSALTAQNTQGVGGIHLPPAEFVGQQIKMIFADIEVAAIKIGMLGSPEIVAAVAEALQGHESIPLVLDPVLAATSGADLGGDGVIAAMRASLFSRATVITPNLHEAARLANAPVPANRGEMESIARHLRADRPAAWLIKGGHGEGTTSDDVLFDGTAFHWFSAPRVQTRNTHGTGCTLSSAISAYLAKGFPLPEAVGLAKTYLSAALAGADALDVGQGPGPVDHFAVWRKGGLL